MRIVRNSVFPQTLHSRKLREITVIMQYRYVRGAFNEKSLLPKQCCCEIDEWSTLRLKTIDPQVDNLLFGVEKKLYKLFDVINSISKLKYYLKENLCHA